MLWLQEAQPVPITESTGPTVLQPSLTTADVKPSLSAGSRHDDVLVPPVVTTSSPAELPSMGVGVASSDDINRDEATPSLSGDLTGYHIVFSIIQFSSVYSICLHVIQTFISILVFIRN